jgi:hypothetical protein
MMNDSRESAKNAKVGKLSEGNPLRDFVASRENNLAKVLRA